MQFSFEPYVVIENKKFQDTCILKLKPKRAQSLISFTAGQYVHVHNPRYRNPHESHAFSIASSEQERDYIELCIKQYGHWTQQIFGLTVGDILEISEAQGDVVYDKNLSSVVFLVGGVGVSPVMSMLRTIVDQEQKPHVTLLYGSQTEQTIVYKDEITQLMTRIPSIRVVYILSHLLPEAQWNGYRGFITEEIIAKEVQFDTKPTFYSFGPPIFVEKMQEVLQKLNVPKELIRMELH